MPPPITASVVVDKGVVVCEGVKKILERIWAKHNVTRADVMGYNKKCRDDVAKHCRLLGMKTGYLPVIIGRGVTVKRRRPIKRSPGKRITKNHKIVVLLGDGGEMSLTRKIMTEKVYLTDQDRTLDVRTDIVRRNATITGFMPKYKALAVSPTEPTRADLVFSETKSLRDGDITRFMTERES